MAINLFPWREAKMKRKNRWDCFFLILIAGFIFSILCAVDHYFVEHHRHCQIQNRRLLDEIAEMKTHQDGNLESEYQLISEQIRLIQLMISIQTDFWRQFSLLQQKTPLDIQLSQFDWTPEKIRLQGETPHPESIGILVKYLEKSLLFSRVALESMEQIDNALSTRFTLAAEK